MFPFTKNFPENLEADSARSLAIRFTQTSNNMHPLDCYIFNFSPLLHFQVWLQRSKALPSPQPTVPVLPANPHALERDSERHVQAVVFGRGGPAPCQQLLFPEGHRPRPQQGAVSANHRKTHAWDSPSISKEAWLLDRVECGSLGRPQCAECTHLHRQVHTGGNLIQRQRC